MFIWYFITVPELPHEVVDQKRSVAIQQYVVREGQNVEAGAAIAVVETWWAVLKVEALHPCRIEKTLFDASSLRGMHLSVGQPLALALCDPEHSPKDGATSRVSIIEMKRRKPS